MSKCVAEFERKAIGEFGGDCKVRIYQVEGVFVPAFYNDEYHVMTRSPVATFGEAVALAIEWIDNSDFHL